MHLLLAVDVDKTNHERLLKAVNSRKYHFSAAREGFNRPHMSEIKFYNLRCKKEIAPFVLKDLNASSLFPTKKISLLDVIKGPEQSGKNAFFDGRFKLIVSYIIQKLGKLVRLEAPEVADRKSIPFIEGWCYTHVLGSIKDINRGHGEEL